MPGHEDKAGRYIALLDAARVNASWSELPELIRKVNKHAPQRQTLIQTATAEHLVATNTTRPLSSTSTDVSALTNLARHLRSQNTHDEEDAVQGKACLLWARWNGLMSQDDSQVAGMEVDTIQPSPRGKSLSTWTKICLVKSAYIEGTNYSRNGAVAEAKSIFVSAVDSMQLDRELVLSTPQLAYWSEQLLAQLTMNASADEETSRTGASTRLEAFRYWYVLATRTPQASASAYGNSSAHASRSSVWKAYYESVSASLRGSYLGDKLVSPEARMQQATELRKVERAYENEILRVRKFPEATESNEPVERWVESVIQNWHSLCGPDWRDAELGEGGRDAVARNVLDILYRAATKTFHSTLILRRLFQVHKYLTEFDLAFKAFDTYIDLVERGRARAAKSSKSQPGLEPTEIVLSTISEAVETLCSFGRQAEARKAYDLCIKLEDWLEELENEYSVEEHTNGTQQNGHAVVTGEGSLISPSILEFIFRSIGVAKAHWARWTPFSEKRAGLQEDALVSLMKACSQFSLQDIQAETIFATGLLLAETREINQAIDLVKQALTRGDTARSNDVQWAAERKSIRLWHLLALLLSARGDYDSATRSCVAAFEQFPSTTILLGSETYSTSNVANSEKERLASSGLVSEMECDELQRMIEIRITELALTELVEGPEEAVNCSNELLSLFSQLFAHLQISLDPSNISRNLQPPKSSAGTVKTMKGSVFSRKRYTSSVQPIPEKQPDNMSMITSTTRPSTRATQAPTIQVTDEQGRSPSTKHHLRSSSDQPRHNHRSSLEGSVRRLAHRHSQRSNHQNSQVPATEAVTSDIRQSAPRHSHDEKSTNISGDARKIDPTMPSLQEQQSESRQLPQMEHNLGPHDRVPPPVSHEQEPPQQDVRLPNLHRHTTATSPMPRFTKLATQKHAITILTKIWLIIATLYRRASMFEDSKEACEEAMKAVSKIEETVGSTDPSARAFADPGWSGGKSVDEIWADVYCERAELHLAIHERRKEEGQEIHCEEVRNAVEQYEQCLMYFPNHPGGIIGLSNVLLDYYEKKVDLSKKVDDGRPQGIDVDKPLPVRPGLSRDMSTMSNGSAIIPRSAYASRDSADKLDEDLKKTPENLNRIAARDRAYGLLSTLTKMGSGWDNSDAWFALARAHELGGEVERAKSILWWCVKLEDSKPIRHWRNLGYGI